MINTTESATSVGHALLSEIERVAAKLERWKGYEKEAGQRVIFGPGIYIMTVAIEEAKTALASNDPISCIRALSDLRGFNDDD